MGRVNDAAGGLAPTDHAGEAAYKNLPRDRGKSQKIKILQENAAHSRSRGKLPSSWLDGTTIPKEGFCGSGGK